MGIRTPALNNYSSPMSDPPCLDANKKSLVCRRLYPTEAVVNGDDRPSRKLAMRVSLILYDLIYLIPGIDPYLFDVCIRRHYPGLQCLTTAVAAAVNG